MITGETLGEHPRCAASHLAEIVDQQINGAARREFDDATSETQESGADLDEGNAYSDSSEVHFTSQSVACGLCKGLALLSWDGSVHAPRCRVSGMCELEWAKKYPEKYSDIVNDPSGNRRIVCGAEIGCKAIIGLQTGGTHEDSVLMVQGGHCEVANRGDDWLNRCNYAIGSAPLERPEAGIPKFDGEGSDRAA